MGSPFSKGSVSRILLVLGFGAVSIFSSFTEKVLPPAKKAANVIGTQLVKYSLDKGKSSVTFNVTHMVVSEVEGNFKVFNGSMETSKPDYSDAKIDFSIDVKSVNTNNANRDKHLRGEDFFNSEKFPAMKFVSTSFVHQDGNNYKLSGDLTIRSVTKPVSFDVTYAGIAADQRTAVFEARTSIDRFDYDLKWSKMTEAGGMVVSKDIKIIVKAAFRVK